MKKRSVRATAFSMRHSYQSDLLWGTLHSCSPCLFPIPAPVPPVHTLSSQTLRAIDALQQATFNRIGIPANWKEGEDVLIDTRVSVTSPLTYSLCDQPTRNNDLTGYHKGLRPQTINRGGRVESENNCVVICFVARNNTRNSIYHHRGTHRS